MYKADRPLTDRSLDEFGLADVADQIASKIGSLQPAEGLVVGLQSPWGTGKSTFLRFLTEKLSSEPKTLIVRFDPWLIADRNVLLHELFAELGKKLSEREKRHKDRPDVSDYRQRREISRLFRRFTTIAESLRRIPASPKITVLSDLLELPVIREFKAIISFILGLVVAFKPRIETLREIRAEIARRLSLLGYKVIVVIDDVDRLEPEEAREVFRLVKAVADFPNTTYIVAFDKGPMHLDSAQDNDVARTYLDKIIQVPIFLPPPELVDLRRVLVETLFGDDGANGMLCRSLRQSRVSGDRNSEEVRFGQVLSPLLRTYLSSPRRLNIIANVMLTGWPDISEDADFCDYLIYTCLQNFDQELFAWVEDYIEVFAISRRSVRSNEQAAKLVDRLNQILDRSMATRGYRLVLLRTLLPAMRPY